MRMLRVSGAISLVVSVSFLVVASGVQPVRAEDAHPSSTNAQSEPTDRSFEKYQGSFLDLTKEAMLARLKIRVAREDKVYAFPDPALGIGSEVRVYRASTVTIKDGTLKARTVRTWAKTVGDLALEQHLDLADKDVVTPPVSEVIPVGNPSFAMTVVRVAESELHQTTPIPFSVKTVDDPEMEKGKTVTEQEGQNGSLKRAYLVRRENGKEISRRLTKEETLKDPVTKVVRRGTKIIQYGTGKASWYKGVAPMSAAHLSLPKGTKVRVVNTDNGKSVVVVIADRGPYVGGRVIDLSSDAFSAIASLGSGVANVRMEKIYSE